LYGKSIAAVIFKNRTRIITAKTARRGVLFGAGPNSPCSRDTGAVVEKLLTQKEVAHRLGISERTLERHRVTGTGPRWARLGRLVRYRVSDLEQWVEASLRTSTSDLKLRVLP
jgi:excisionase family DNA binding protein